MLGERDRKGDDGRRTRPDRAGGTPHVAAAAIAAHRARHERSARSLTALAELVLAHQQTEVRRRVGGDEAARRIRNLGIRSTQGGRCRGNERHRCRSRVGLALVGRGETEALRDPNGLELLRALVVRP